ncbi:hypothetical protein MXL97_07060 [Mammaliicoccus fleurettii]|uniref:hypothetical protein n=1 Tax=Mammaliicoccus fleurettii TaxID=150056 RepID=UPI002DBF5B45|nr:hypothetical protein [Mammaliicoccus fleurettii]MEB6201574.1 hypothetical protein [Mammaliicoccus fleurettii]
MAKYRIYQYTIAQNILKSIPTDINNVSSKYLTYVIKKRTKTLEDYEQVKQIIKEFSKNKK